MRLPKPILLTFGLLFGFFAVLLAARYVNQPYTFHGSLLASPVAAADFALTDQNSNVFHLSDVKGQAVLIFFGYTFCPDVCPATLTRFKQVRAELGATSEQVKFILITVDPERDPPERLQAYLQNFDPTFVGLTGTMPDLENVWKSYGVFREKKFADGTESASGHAALHTDYLVDHTVRIYAIDPQGNLRLTYTADITARELADDVRELLK